jgi:hypothetical protein
VLGGRDRGIGQRQVRSEEWGKEALVGVRLGRARVRVRVKREKGIVTGPVRAEE